MKLLLGDDHRMFLDALGAGLTRHGHDVVGVSHELDGLVELVLERQPDACVLDVDFAGRTVLDQARAIRTQAPQVSIVLLAGATSRAVWQSYEDRYVDGVVDKLCDLTVLDRALRRVRAGDRVVEGVVRPLPRQRNHPGARSLSERERNVVSLLVAGLSTEQMAADLGVSNHTVRSHVQSVLLKYGVSSRAKVAALAVSRGDVEIPAQRTRGD